MAKPFSRRLSPLERLWLVADQLTPPFVNQLVLEGEGQCDQARWRQAAAQAGEANPGSRLVVRGNLWWTRWVDSQVDVPVRVVDGNRWSGFAPEGADFLSDTMSPRRGPTTEILLVSGTPARVVVRTHHAVMDGGGHLHFVADLFRCLRGEAPVGADANVTDLDLARRLGSKKPAPREPDCLAPTGEVTDGPPGVTWRRLSVPGRHSQLLPRIAICLAAHARGACDANVRIDMPVDMRQHFSEPVRSTANLTGMLHMTIEPELTPTQLATRIREAVGEHAEASFVEEMAPVRFVPLWLMRFVGRSETKKSHRSNRWITTGALSNLGKVPHHDLHGGGFRTVTSFFIPPGTDGTALFMAINGRPDGIELCVTIPHRLADSGRIDGCLAAVEAELQKTAKTVARTAG